MKRALALSTILFLAALPVLPQFGGIVHDPINQGELVSIGTQAALTVRNLQSLEQWGKQIALSKIPWVTHLPSAAQSTQPHNTMGELATWGATVATGQMAGPSWQNARYQLGNIAVLIAQERQMRASAQVGTPILSQLATVEALDAAGTNNLAVVGQARNYLSNDLPAMQNLSRDILSPRLQDNGPTQQMQFVAASGAQNTSTAVHNLQVNAGILETVTGFAKAVSDANSADLNLRIQQAQTRTSQPTSIRGMGAAFANHP